MQVQALERRHHPLEIRSWGTSAGSAAGLITLALQTVKGLVEFYSAYKDRDDSISRTISRLRSVLESLDLLGRTLTTRKFSPHEKDVVDKVNQDVHECKDVIEELEEECKKFTRPSSTTAKAALKFAGRKLEYPFRKSTLERLEEDTRSLQENLSVTLDVLQLRGTYTVQNDVADTKALIDLVRASQISSEIRTWLKAPDATENYNAAVAKRHANTGLWLVNSAKFERWLTEDNSFLWLSGFAGCGKTVLTSTTIEHTFLHRGSNRRIGIAFFYFSFTDTTKQDAAGMVRAFLLQLSNQLPDGPSILGSLHSKCTGSVPSLSALMDALRETVEPFHAAYFLIDALDESPRDGKRETVLETIKTMRNWSLRGVHILVSSRDDRDIREHLSTLDDQEVSLKNSGVDNDIFEFVSQHLRHSPKLSRWSDHYDEIEKALVQKANGMFRWVECQFISLAECRSKYHLDKALESLPRSLDETYVRMIANIDPDYANEVKTLLTWLCSSKRPMTVKEIIDVLAIELDTSSLNKARRMGSGDDILHICPGLVTIEENPNNLFPLDLYDEFPIVRIAHFSVQEYLFSNRVDDRIHDFALEYSMANATIAQMCLAYLLDPGLSKETLRSSDLRDLPLAGYAAVYCGEHLIVDEDPKSPANRLALWMIQERWNNFRNWTRSFGPWYFLKDISDDDDYASSRIPTPLIFASLLNLYGLVRGILDNFGDSLSESKHGINAEVVLYGTALTAALSKKHCRVAKLLINRGIDVNKKLKYSPCSTALQLASRQGLQDIVELLISKGADVNAHDRVGTALISACEGGYENIAKILINNGADVNIRALGGYDALIKASKSGHRDIVELLINQGADINFLESGHTNALIAASESGHRDIVELLINRGADINLESGDTNALIAASRVGHQDVVELLINRGAEVRLPKCSASHPLMQTLYRQYEETLEILFSQRASIDVLAELFSNRLVRYSGLEVYKDVVKNYIALRAYVKIEFNGGQNILYLASGLLGSYDKIVEFLMDKGLDVVVKDGDLKFSTEIDRD
ncbi:hypothetical protein AJ79_09136 [Helicocarpus griseus UAMH5409]|uniref:Uncharacterized protein n=1 Tax=Helicocarpus griseus UAMH5409 TaxID=1447875 RepID=A0A2B7WLZ7_9EURO|nr:hypothetical protein AJ79_09136 [Helicocarpus griseus UAMH5409]